MLKDRRVLLEQEIAKMKQECGQLYLKIVKKTASQQEEAAYATMREELADMMTDLDILNQMIVDGHE